MKKSVHSPAGSQVETRPSSVLRSAGDVIGATSSSLPKAKVLRDATASGRGSRW